MGNANDIQYFRLRIKQFETIVAIITKNQFIL